MLYNVFVSNLYLLLVAFVSKVSINLFHPLHSELLLSNDGLYALLWGLRMDFAIVSLLATLCLFYDLLYCSFHNKNSFFGKLPLALAMCWLMVSMVTDYMYFSDSGRHITFEVFTGGGAELSLFITGVIQYTAEFITGLALVLAFMFLLKNIRFRDIYPNGKLKPIALFFLFWPLIAVSAARGGWMDAPQSPMSTYKIGSNHLADLAWSAPFSITYYLVKGPKKAAKKVTPDLSASQLQQMATSFSAEESASLSMLKPYNVIVVLLESWAAVDMQGYAHKINATPFFDSLRERSLSTQATYANGFRTVEGLFASFCSYPNPVGGGIAGTQLQNNQYYCLPKILKEQGWDTRFVQGSGKGAVGSFAQSIGFELSFGKTDFGFETQRNYWGYMDESIYQFSLEQIKDAKSPYLITINTGTTHDRYLPDESDYKFGDENNELERASVLHYADNELREFITRLESSVSEPTLVVLMSDHTAGVTRKGLAQNSIPFLMFAINAELPSKKLNIANSQRDIAPTILDFLGGRAPWFTGQSILGNNQHGCADFTKGETMSCIVNDKMVEVNAKTSELSACYQVDVDTVTTIQVGCSSAYDQVYQQAKEYMLYSQQMLFDDRTLEYHLGAKINAVGSVKGQPTIL